MTLRHFLPVMPLADIASLGGFKMQGAAVDDYAGFNFGQADVNGDGLSDLIVCADGYDGGGLLAGGAFVIYGKADGITPFIDFADLVQTDGFVIQGEFAFDLASRMISGAGDVNGDGIEDLFIGAFKNDEGGHDSGAAYIIYGKTDPFDVVLDLYDLPADVGIKIVGEAAEDYASFWVASAGDVNGDGRNDLIMGAPQNDANGSDSGAAYVIFGRDSNFPAKIALSALDPSTGFKISGAMAGDQAGLGVSSAGDLNGDGLADLAIGVPQSASGRPGEVQILYGRADIGATDLAQPIGSRGFVIRGEAGNDMTGANVASAGDVNGDGIDDLVIGAPQQDAGGRDAGAAYVVFGRAGGISGDLDLATLNGTNGFKIVGSRAGDQLGGSVSGAGDVNGDGLADILIGAWTSSVNGTGAGEAYLLFGKSTGFAPTIDLATLNQRDGIRIRSEGDGDTTGRAVSAAGDMNGDGYDDIAIGSPGNGVGGSEAGAAHVLFGRPDNRAPTALDSRVQGVEGSPYVFTPADFGFADSDGDALAEVRIVSPASRGTLMLRAGDDTSAAVAAGQAIAVADIAAGRLTFIPAAFESGTDYATVSFVVRDDGGLVGQGADTASLAATLAIGVTADPGNGEDIVYGTVGDDVLTAGSPRTLLVGLRGDDTYIVGSQDHRVAEAAGEGSDTVRTSVSYTLANGAEIERLEAADAAATVYLRLEGNAFGNVIVGNAGANSLIGGGGANVLEGLGGNDSYLVSSAADRIVEQAGGGRDTVYALTSYTLSAGAEVETFLAYDRNDTLALALGGNELDNLILGNNGANVLTGGGGRDTMYGYRGDDLFYVDSADDLPVELFNEGYDTIVTSVSYVMPQGMAFELLRTIDDAATTAIDLTGNKVSNLIIGNAGSNVIDGLGGGDDMRGLGGEDTYIVRNVADRVRETAGGGRDTVRTLVSYELAGDSEIEVLEAFDPLATTPLRLTGNRSSNMIVGNAGDNALIGAGGGDILRGLGGDDSYIVGDAAERVVELAGGGYDTVYATADYTLEVGSAVEVLTAYERETANDLRLTGNELANTLYGDAGSNVLDGGGGADILYGLGGDDTYYLDDAGDRIVELAGGGRDIVYTSVAYEIAREAEIEVLATRDPGSTVGLRLTGNELANEIHGAAGLDSIIGGGGGDRLFGHGGNDSYVVSDAAATVFEEAGEGYDTVYATVSYALSGSSSVEALTVYDRATGNAIDLTGNAVANTIYGNNGANRIDGGAGSDLLFGLGGSDTFVFSTAPGTSNVDRIVDFTSGIDRLELDSRVFQGATAGPLDEMFFAFGTQAQDADDRIIYDSASGSLFYDADGTGNGAALLFAQLTPNTLFATTDLLFV